jgi:uncharacterized protein
MAVPAKAPAQPAVRELEDVWIPLSDGARLSARLWLPPGAQREPVPAIVEVSPYRHEDHTRRRDAVRHPYFAEHGYASLRIDIRGSGASDGVLEDEYSEREQRDVCEALAWIAAQPWSTGSVGMIGLSWGGFAALQAAARRPPELKAVIAVCASADRYGADVKYRGGCLLGCELLPWSSTMLAMNVRPPDPALVGRRWRELWLERLEQAHPFAETWLAHQRRDAYWLSGSPAGDYDAIACPVYAVGGWADPYRQAVLDLLENLSCARKGLIGPWSHQYPDEGTPGPAIDFRRECVRWWDHWLKGEDTGIMREPQLRVWMQEGVPPRAEHRPTRGRWVDEDVWPPRAAAPRSLRLGDGVLAERRQARRRLLIRGAQRVGSAAGAWCPWGRAELPGDQRREDELSLTFTSQPLHERLEILGSPAVTLELASDRPLALVTVRLCDVSPSGASTLVARGLLNLAHRAGSEEPAPLEPGRRETVRAPLDAAAYAFRPGHRLRIAVSPTYWPWAWPSPETVTLTPYGGRLELPVRKPRPEDAQLPEFGAPEHSPALEVEEREGGTGGRYLRKEHATGLVEQVFDWDLGGSVRLVDIDLESSDTSHTVYSIVDGDPLSAAVRFRATSGMGRGDWQTLAAVESSMTSDADSFHVETELTVTENEDEIFTRRWSFAFPRDNV